MLQSAKTALQLVLVVVIGWYPASGIVAQELPALGSDASLRVFQPGQAEAIGRSLMLELRGRGLVLEDPELESYLDSLGYRLVAQSEQPDQDFTFYTVKDNTVNAFATPGGFIGIHTGLMLVAESESELAGVVAHEIAHVTQDHLARTFENVSKLSLPLTLLMLGALVAGGGSDAGPAAVVGSQALLQQQYLNYTRAHEYEADRLGIRTLARANFDPNGMAGMFERLGRSYRVVGVEIPEFLRTHPITSTRIAEAKNRARQLPPTTVKSDNARFRLLQARARVLASGELRQTSDYFASLIADDTLHADRRRAVHYGMALVDLRDGNAARAVQGLTRLVDADPHDLHLQIALQRARYAAGDRESALTALADLARDRPDHYLVTVARAELLLDTGHAAHAAVAETELRDLLPAHNSKPSMFERYARAAEAAGMRVRAGEAFAEYSLLIGRPFDAMAQLQKLARRSDLDRYQRARIRARLAEIEPHLDPSRDPMRQAQRRS